MAFSSYKDYSVKSLFNGIMSHTCGSEFMTKLHNFDTEAATLYGILCFSNMAHAATYPKNTAAFSTVLGVLHAVTLYLHR